MIKSEFACQSEQPPHLSFVYNFAEIRFYTKESEGSQATRVDAGGFFFVAAQRKRQCACDEDIYR